MTAGDARYEVWLDSVHLPRCFSSETEADRLSRTWELDWCCFLSDALNSYTCQVLKGDQFSLSHQSFANTVVVTHTHTHTHTVDLRHNLTYRDNTGSSHTGRMSMDRQSTEFPGCKVWNPPRYPWVQREQMFSQFTSHILTRNRKLSLSSAFITFPDLERSPKNHHGAMKMLSWKVSNASLFITLASLSFKFYLR